MDRNAKLNRQIDAWVDAHAKEVVDLARELVRIPTENLPPSGDEGNATAFLTAQLKALGADVDVFSPLDVPGLTEHPGWFPKVDGQDRQLSGRPNVVGRLDGDGGGRSLLLSTHIDTVPAGRAEWTTGSPFGGEIVDGRLYGRGSYDTKAALASHLVAMRCLGELGVARSGSVTIEAVVDEEFGGSHGVLASRLRGHTADLAINSEPTHLAVCPAHRGGREAYLRFRGSEGMAFDGEEQADPMLALARAIVAVKSFAAESPKLRERGSAQDGMAALEPAGPPPAYINQIGGGGTTYLDAVGTAEAAYAHIWAEVNEEIDEEAFDEALLDWIHSELDDHPDTLSMRTAIEPTTRYLPASSMPLDHPGLAVLAETYGDLEIPFSLRRAPFACDAYVFNKLAGIPAVILGPGGGNAHAADEFVEVGDLILLCKICAHFIHAWTA